MSDYTQITSFGPKDSLTTGDPNKKIRGTQIDPEFSAISSAIQSKFDSTDLASEAEAAALTSDSKLITPAKLLHALESGTFTLGEDVSVEGTDTFPNVAGPVTATDDELNVLDGVTVSASDINSIGPRAYKTATTTRASTTTLTVDPHLSVSVEANAVYAVDLFFLSDHQGSSNAGLVAGFTAPSGAAFAAAYDAVTSTGSVPSFILDSISDTANFTGGTTTIQSGHIIGSLQTAGTAGTFAFRWAQVISDSNGTKVYVGSWLKLTRIS